MFFFFRDYFSSYILNAERVSLNRREESRDIQIAVRMANRWQDESVIILKEREGRLNDILARRSHRVL